MSKFKRVASNYYVEPYDYRSRFHGDLGSNHQYIISRCLYDIEKAYLYNKIGTDDITIFHLDYLDDKSKLVYYKLNGYYKFGVVNIPRLDYIRFSKLSSHYYYVYHWKKPSGELISRVVSNKLYSRNHHRYYVVGDFNKYGHQLIKISTERFVDGSYSYDKYVGLVFDD